MTTFWDWILICTLVVAFHITPVFAPPTIALLAYFQVVQGKDPIQLAIIGGVAATAGKIALTYISRLLGNRIIPAARRSSIQALVQTVSSRRSLGLSYLALFAIGPIPKGTLFAAVGLARISPIPGGIVFGVTRTGFYFASLLVVDTAAASIEDLFDMSIAGTVGIVLQVISLIAVIVLFRVDPDRLLSRFPRIAKLWQALLARIPQPDKPDSEDDKSR